MAVALDARFGHADIAAHGGQRNQGEAQRVRAVLVDHVKGIDAVAEALGHLAALFVTHQRMNVGVAEGNLSHEVLPHHDHAGHPEEENVKGRHQDGSGIEGLQILGFVRPAHGGERPERGGKPCVKHVRILFQTGTAALGADRGVGFGNNEFPAVRAGPGRDAMSPPYLAADAPVADVVQPVVVGLHP